MSKCLLFSYWRTITVCVIILILSTVSFGNVPSVVKFNHNDKFVHLLMYMGLGFIAYYEYSKHNLNNKGCFRLVLFFLIFILFGGAIEILQGTVFKPRSAELADWIADIAGVCLGGLSGRLFFKNKPHSD